MNDEACPLRPQATAHPACPEHHLTLSEIVRLHLDLADVPVEIGDVTAPERSRWRTAQVGRRRSMMELVAVTVRQRERVVALADARQLGRQVFDAPGEPAQVASHGLIKSRFRPCGDIRAWPPEGDGRP